MRRCAMILQSLDRYLDLGIIDEDGRIRYAHRGDAEMAGEPLTAGVCSSVDGVFVARYDCDSSVYARFGETIICLTDDVAAGIRPNGTQNRFSLTRGGETLFEVDYTPPVMDPPLSIDPTPFVEEEDFDIHLHIRNVVNDKARLARLRRGQT